MTNIRRALDLPGRAATSVGAALLALLAPKCPVCVAAYLAGLGLGLGAGASHSAAPFVRPVALVVAGVAALALVLGVGACILSPMLRTLELEILRFVDDSQPGWVERRLVDAAAGVHRFVEKAPIVSELPLDRDSGYPRPGMLACTVVGAS